MGQVLVGLGRPEQLAVLAAACAEQFRFETDLLESRHTDLLVLDQEALQALGPRLGEMRLRGTLRSVLLLAPPADVLQRLAIQTQEPLLFDDYLAPDASPGELKARIQLCLSRHRGSGSDVAAAHRPTEEQAALQRAFRALAEDSPDVVTRYGPDLRYQYANAAIERVTGRSPESFLGKTHLEAGFDPDRAAFWDERLRRGFATGQATRTEFSYSNQDGLRFFESRQAPERAADGSIASMVVVTRDMTDRVLAEGNLRLSEARLAEALALAGTGSWDLDPESGCSNWSRDSYLLFGYDPNGPAPSVEAFLERIHPDDRSRFPTLDSFVAGEAARTIEFRLRLPSGELRHLVSRAHVSQDPQTGRKRIVGATTDVTERKFRELERESERSLLEMVARGAPVDECLDHMARAQQALFPGTLCSVYRTTHNNSLLLAAGFQEYPEALSLLTELPIGPSASPCGRAAHFQQWILADDLWNSPLWSEVRPLAIALGVQGCVSVPVYSSQQEVIGTFALYFREPRQPTPEETRCLERAASLAGLAIERDRYHRALAENEALLRTVFDNSPIGIYLCDPHGHVVYMNRAVDNLLGVKPTRLLGRRWFRYLHRDDKRAVAASLEGLMTGQTQSLDMSWRQRTVSGESKTLQVHANTIQGSGGRQGFVGTIEDITARLRFEEQHRQGQKMEAVGQLAGGVAHDFNNLLTVILNGVSLLEPPRSIRDQRLVHQIELAAERAAALTKQLLAFGRRQRMSTQVVDLNDLVVNLCDMLRRLIGEQNILEAVLASGGAPALVDANMFEQVVLNLVVNARDAMPRGGKIVLRLATVHSNHPSLSERRPGQAPYLRLSVTDTGVGIARHNLARVFEPFFTTKEPGKGTGLGLATVYAIVEQHGGFIEVDSRLGGGTTVQVYLPRALAPVTRVTQPLFPAPRGTETILLAEDEPAVRDMVRNALESCGYRVLEAKNGDQALSIWQAHQHEISLLLTDMIMPGSLLGRELAQRLRADRPNLYVIYMSGYGGQDLWLDARSRFVAKPFQVSTLGRLVRECLEVASDESRARAHVE